MKDTDGEPLKVGEFYAVDIGNVRMRGILLWDSLGKEWCICCTEADIRYPIVYANKLYHVSIDDLANQ